jgi:hypothetical protein
VPRQSGTQIFLIHSFAASIASVQRDLCKLTGEKTPEARALILTGFHWPLRLRTRDKVTILSDCTSGRTTFRAGLNNVSFSRCPIIPLMVCEMVPVYSTTPDWRQCNEYEDHPS